MKTKFIGVILSMFVVLGVTSLHAVSLQAKINYMETLKQEAASLEEEGYYDESIEKSLEVQALTEEIDVLIAVLKKWNQLQRSIALAKQIGADRVAKEEFDLAVNLYKSAEREFVDENLEKAEFDTEEGLYYIDLAIEKAQDTFNEQFDNQTERGRANINTSHNVELTKVEGEYVVRLIPNKRDCLWRIAEYDFIYGDPWQWRRIYNANREIIKDPDLIYPGQKLVIPPLPYDPELE